MIESPKSPDRIRDIEREPAFHDLTVFTTTFYGTDDSSKVRQGLALKLFQNAEELGVRCIVVDGGSNQEFLERVRAFKNVTLFPQHDAGMGAGRREALRHAMEGRGANDAFYLWVEPEKEGLLTEESLTRLLKPLREHTNDIVVPAREDMHTLPRFQAWTEQRANKRAMELVEEDAHAIWDLWFGPKAFNAEGAKYFLDYKGELDKWDAIIKPVIEAYNDGKHVTSVPVNFQYSEEQRGNEEGSREFKKKRVEQYATILAEIGDEFWKQKLKEKSK